MIGLYLLFTSILVLFLFILNYMTTKDLELGKIAMALFLWIGLLILIGI